MEQNLHQHMKWSPDLRAFSVKICKFMGIVYRKPADPVEHQSLSFFNALLVDKLLLPALTVLYYACVLQDKTFLQRHKVLVFAGFANYPSV